MNLLFLDFETQGLDVETTNPTQLAACEVVTSDESEFSHMVNRLIFNHLIYEPSYPPQPKEVSELTGITDELLMKKGMPTKFVLHGLKLLMEKADLVLAHNAVFDRSVYLATCKRFDMEPAKPKEGWLCTRNDIPWPKKYKCKQLSHLAFDLGLDVERSRLHQADYDIDLLVQVTFEGVPFATTLSYFRSPWIMLAASGILAPWQDGGEANAKVKALGYAWQTVYGTNIFVEKTWVKRVKQHELESELALATGQFQVRHWEIPNENLS